MTTYIDRNNQIYIIMNTETKRIVLRAMLEVDKELLLNVVSDFVPDDLINQIAREVIKMETAKKKK